MKIRRILWVRVALIALFLTAVLSLPNIASNSPLQLAQAPNCKSPQTTVDMNLCATQEFQAADKKLNQVYQKLKPMLNSKQQQRLTAAQRTWVKFRDESCDYESGRFEGGTLAGSTYGYCRARITQERVKDLERYLKEANS
ncbi:MAG: lysozyme inhibitor LprI family protein [Microcoleus sp.]